MYYMYYVSRMKHFKGHEKKTYWKTTHSVKLSGKNGSSFDLSFDDCLEKAHYKLKVEWCCWWTKSCSTWNVCNPVNNGMKYQPQLVQDFFHQQWRFYSNLSNNFKWTKMLKVCLVVYAANPTNQTWLKKTPSDHLSHEKNLLTFHYTGC